MLQACSGIDDSTGRLKPVAVAETQTYFSPLKWQPAHTEMAWLSSMAHDRPQRETVLAPVREMCEVAALEAAEAVRRTVAGWRPNFAACVPKWKRHQCCRAIHLSSFHPTQVRSLKLQTIDQLLNNID